MITKAGELPSPGKVRSKFRWHCLSKQLICCGTTFTGGLRSRAKLTGTWYVDQPKKFLDITRHTMTVKYYNLSQDRLIT
ncbi:hypothetical protein F9C07_4762 [Aspergillus flavus]|uniref:Uncharacterized protein n=1 Tax=Aspergillus flavus (strain ATCC 200026 / FGSC A1120 / IAM 13836 / NRRL 3357 / JCM 12722 / SRRC 167) TaxID=332952 RepID=A0A7U2QUW3_ASPFN|nr:hypothetical protein F9C07_4762 [Aspergillus flavus]